MSANLVKCKKCNYWLISKELEDHRCKQIQRGRIDGDIFWVNDGERWYPLKLPPQWKHPDRTPQETTM